jgi:uncharacterized membrane protein YcaP (DUF421 family)
MDSVIRGVAIYLFLLVMFRISGKRTLGEMTPFEFVLVLIIGEASAQAMMWDDFSMINAFLVIITLVGIDVGLSLLKQRSKRLEKMIDSVPLVIVENGKLLKDRMEKARVDEADILEKARELQGLERLDQIKYAVVERSGGISIIPKTQGG